MPHQLVAKRLHFWFQGVQDSGYLAEEHERSLKSCVGLYEEAIDKVATADPVIKLCSLKTTTCFLPYLDIVTSQRSLGFSQFRESAWQMAHLYA